MNDYYFNVENDLNDYPEAWCYICVGGRNCGKTYSALKSCYLNNRKFVFLKRTMDDVDLLCAGSGKLGAKENEYSVDLSPFKSINRDIGSEIKAFSIRKGIGGFWRCSDGEPVGEPIGYIMSLSGVTKFKGFDLSECDWIIFDEFIPQKWDRVNRKEGEQLMDLYKTVARDREHRNRGSLKLVCLANATDISNPTMNILEVADIVAQMQVTGSEIEYLDLRGIVLHIIKDNPEFTRKEKESKIYKAMGNTAWGRMAFDNQFSYNDFSCVGRTSLKGFKPVCALSYKNDNFYIYQKEGQYYMTYSKHTSEPIYNLNRESEQKLFYLEQAIDLRSDTIEGNVLFETYTMYDLIMNYRKHFSV